MPGQRATLSELQEAYPDEWEAVRRDLAAIVERGRPEELRAYLANPRPRGRDRVAADVRRRMAAEALRGYGLAAATGRTGRLRFNLVCGFVAQRLLFRRGLERKAVSLRTFRLVWPLVWQRRLLMPLVQPKGIYCFYSDRLLDGLVRVIDGRDVLEIGAGDGTLARLLAERGVTVTAVDDHSWAHVIDYPDHVLRRDAVDALRAYAPRVVICSWPPAANAFERQVFRTRSVELYVMIGSRHEFAAGDWEAYRTQTAFTVTEDEALSRLVLPPELDSAVYLFERG